MSIGGTGHLEGDVSTKSGGKIPLTLTFVKENGGWKIYSIQKSQAGLVAESGGQAIPSKTEAAKLAVDTTLSFARAVNANDLKAFYAQTAAEFSLLCLHPSRVCRHRAYCKWRATSRLRNPTSTSLTNTSIGLRIGRLWVSTSTSNLLTTKQYSSFCFWLSAWFRPSANGQHGSNDASVPIENCLTVGVQSTRCKLGTTERGEITLLVP